MLGNCLALCHWSWNCYCWPVKGLSSSSKEREMAECVCLPLMPQFFRIHFSWVRNNDAVPANILLAVRSSSSPLPTNSSSHWTRNSYGKGNTLSPLFLMLYCWARRTIWSETSYIMSARIHVWSAAIICESLPSPLLGTFSLCSPGLLNSGSSELNFWNCSSLLQQSCSLLLLLPKHLMDDKSPLILLWTKN